MTPARSAMRAVVQRVSEAAVDVDGAEISRIGRGLLVYLGIATTDGPAEADWIIGKLLDVRVFERAAGQFDASVVDVGGAVLIVSQFTLYADTRKGRRPSFSRAAAAAQAEPLYLRVVRGIAERGVPVGAGRFGAHMVVRAANAGPVTLIIDTPAQAA